MREAPQKIPSTLPNIRETAAFIQKEVIDRPDIRLADMSIGRLILDASDGSPTYLVGSNVWVRAVFGMNPRERYPGFMPDYDVILSSESACEGFIANAIALLNTRLPSGVRYSRTQNAFGHGRIMDHKGTPLIDAWALRNDQSIAEELMTFPAAYQRAAYQVTRDPNPLLLRIIMIEDILSGEVEYQKMKSMGAQKYRDRYPGRNAGLQYNEQGKIMEPLSFSEKALLDAESFDD